MKIEKISVAELKRRIAGTQIRLVARYNEIAGKSIEQQAEYVLSGTHKSLEDYTQVIFNSLYMIRQLADGRLSYLPLKGIKVYWYSSGFAIYGGMWLVYQKRS